MKGLEMHSPFSYSKKDFLKALSRMTFNLWIFYWKRAHYFTRVFLHCLILCHHWYKRHFVPSTPHLCCGSHPLLKALVLNWVSASTWNIWQYPETSLSQRKEDATNIQYAEVSSAANILCNATKEGSAPKLSTTPILRSPDLK